MNLILDSNKKAYQYLKDVQINQAKVAEFVNEFKDVQIAKTTNTDFFLYKWSIQDAFNIELIFNALNFCYWSEKGKEKWKVKVNNQELDGSIALFRLLEVLAYKNKEFLDYKYLAKLSFNEFKNLFKDSNVEIPLLTERYENFKLLGTEILKKYNGDSFLLIKQSQGCAVRMLNRLKALQAFEDISVFNGSTIYFYKRAQLQVKMYNDLLIINQEQTLRNLHKLTAFADYKVPQILRHLGILEYSKELALLVDSQTLIAKDSEVENEIRIATIVATDMISEEFKAVGRNIISAEIDSLLWNRAASNKDAMKPYHRTYTLAY